MLEAARERARREGTPVEFLEDDAQHHAFRERFDTVISRFGVMFFAGPERAFANLRRAADEGSRLRFVAWRAAAHNTFLTTAEHAAAGLLPAPPPPAERASGQFSFGDADRVRQILTDGGWGGIDIRPLDVECSFPETQLVPWFTRLGPLGRALAGRVLGLLLLVARGAREREERGTRDEEEAQVVRTHDRHRTPGRPRVYFCAAATSVRTAASGVRCAGSASFHADSW